MEFVWARERQTGGIPPLASLSHSHKLHKTPSHSHVPQSVPGAHDSSIDPKTTATSSQARDTLTDGRDPKTTVSGSSLHLVFTIRLTRLDSTSASPVLTRITQSTVRLTDANMVRLRRVWFTLRCLRRNASQFTKDLKALYEALYYKALLRNYKALSSQYKHISSQYSQISSQYKPISSQCKQNAL